MITNDRSDVHGKNENQRSKVKVTEVKIQFRPFLDRNSSLNSLIDFEIMHKASRSIEKVPYYFFKSSIEFQGHIGRKIEYLNPILSKITRLLADLKSLRFDLFLLYFHTVMHSFLYFLRHDPIFPAHSPTGGLEFSNENIQQHCGKSGHPV